MNHVHETSDYLHIDTLNIYNEWWKYIRMPWEGQEREHL